MFWKIIFYIWLFCTVFNLGECFYADVKLKRNYGEDAISKGSLFEKFWDFIKLIVICAFPIFNFMLFIILMFKPEELYNGCKRSVEKKIKEQKEDAI